MLDRLSGIYTKAKAIYEKQSEGPFKGLRFSASNMLIQGDNADLLSHLKGRKEFDFVYIDPPFYSGANYKARIKESDGYLKKEVYTDTWESLDEYLTMLLSRLFLIKDVLKESGTVAVHLDTHASHYIKVLMDELFGPENFVNEIVWSYKSGGSGRRSFSKKHDTILVYSKTSKYYFNPQKEVSYNRGFRPYKFKGVEEFQDEEGKWYTLVNQKDVISVDMVGRTSKERTGYATQKPEKLLEILVKAFCPEDGLCADFFCGSGSLGIAAAKNNRRFIMCDVQKIAIEMATQRLKQEKIKFSLR